MPARRFVRHAMAGHGPAAGSDHGSTDDHGSLGRGPSGTYCLNVLSVAGMPPYPPAHSWTATITYP